MFRILRRLLKSAAPARADRAAQAPDSGQTVMTAALLAYQRRDYAEAGALLEPVIARRPTDLPALQMLAAVRLAQDQPDEACRLLTRATALSPDSVELQLASAQAAAKSGDHEAALACHERAIRLRPDFAPMHAVAGDLCEKAGRIDDGIRYYRQAIALDPGFGTAWLNLGRLLHRSDRSAQASECFERVIALDPDNPKAHHNLGLLREHALAFAEAEAAYRRAVDLDPGFHAARLNLGAMLYELGRLDEAKAEFEQCDRLAAGAAAAGSAGGAREAPDSDVDRHARVQTNLALAYLGCGRFSEGWALFERRFDVAAGVASARPFRQPRWNGAALDGRRLLVWGEQGVGDEILHAGMFRELSTLDGAIHLECHAKLAPLFARSFPWMQVVPRATPPLPVLESADCQIAAGSLGSLYRTSLASFPERNAYLVPDPERHRHWRGRIAALGPGLKIGFSWRSSNLAGARALSCTRLDEWAPLFEIPGVSWVCLQYDDCVEELEAVASSRGVRLHRFPEVDYFDDLDEVAALMSALDLVVSAPTTVSVQAAALGIETWQMSFGSDWQTHGTGRNPWLPAIARYQRRWQQPWADVLGDVATDLWAKLQGRQR